ncbi:MAG: ABC-F family ATP-binding cassette domain-containing protein [Nitratireductor sp.]|nr:ABC-F family ATP-binding cassette domain-containing protein [Nitratireductor sp.]
MAPPLLYLADIALTFGGTPLLTGAGIQVHAGDRIALVGRNGSGKSTLLKIAAGEVEPDRGERFLQPGTTVRYLPQEPDLTPYATLGDYVREGLAPGDDPHRADYLMAELGLDGDGGTKTLSGGEARRAALARTLAPEPDILLLDEPTNHLDLPAIEWLEAELSGRRSAIVMISHDRRFLSRLARKTVWMDRGRSRQLDKGFDAFEDWRDKVLEEEETASHKLGRQIVREEHWITHGVSGRRKRNMRRVRELAELRSRKAGETRVQGNVALATADAAVSGKLVAKLDQVSKAFDGRTIVDRFSAIIMRGERIGIVGPNGAGKTTLVNLITGRLQPDSGTIRLGLNLDTLVIDQKRQMLDPAWTLKDALTDGAGDMVAIGETTRHVMSYMKDFLFLPEQARTPVHALSGGERGRLMLARGLRNASNFLVLDEPTNDLDLETLDLLQEFIAEYAGTVLLVSHDRDFIDRTCTLTLASDGKGRWLAYAGGYSDMLAQRKGAEGPAPRAGIKGARPVETGSAGRETAAIPGGKAKPSARLSFKQKHALETLPAEIGKLQADIARLRTALAAPDLYAKDPARFARYAEALEARETALSDKESEWLELEMLREELEG